MFYLIISLGKFWNHKCWFIITDAEVDQVLHGKRNCKMTEKDGSIGQLSWRKGEEIWLSEQSEKPVRLMIAMYSHQNSITMKEELAQLNV